MVKTRLETFYRFRSYYLMGEKGLARFSKTFSAAGIDLVKFDHKATILIFKLQLQLLGVKCVLRQ